MPFPDSSVDWSQSHLLVSPRPSALPVLFATRQRSLAFQINNSAATEAYLWISCCILSHCGAPSAELLSPPQRFGKSRTLFTWYFTCKGRSLNLRAGVALWVILTALFSHSRTLLLMIKGAIVSVVKSVLVCLSVLHKAERKQWSLVSRLARPRSLLFTLSWRFRPSLGSRIVPKPFCKQENV